MMIYGDNSEQTYDINVLIYQTLERKHIVLSVSL